MTGIQTVWSSAFCNGKGYGHDTGTNTRNAWCFMALFLQRSPKMFSRYDGEDTLHAISNHPLFNSEVKLVTHKCVRRLGHHWFKLEQLECRRSEDTPHRPMIIHTIDQFILDPKSKQDKMKVTDLKNLSKLQILEFWKSFTCNTPSEVAS